MPTEILVFAFDALSRRWRLFLLPLLLVAPLAAYLLLTTPLRYTAKSSIMLQAANRSLEVAGGVVARASALEQVSAIEAWLKSDDVLRPLLPRLIDGPMPQTLTGQMTELDKIRRALKLEFVGSAVLEMSLEGTTARGLGRKLEIIVSRMMEGLLNPEAGILSAPQLVLLRRSESFNEAEYELQQAIATSGLGAPDSVMRNLKELYDLQREAIVRGDISTGGSPLASRSIPDRAERPVDIAARIEERRRALSPEMRLVTRLELLYASYEEARQGLEIAKRSVGARADTYVRIFEAPERLTIVGRPRDPVDGKNPAFRFAVAGLFMATLLGAGLVYLSEAFDPRLRTRRDFESFAGLPIVTRIPSVQVADLQAV